MNSKVNILIASLYEREECLLDTLNSLIPQLKKTDTINLFLQGYTTVPKCLDLVTEDTPQINILYDLEYKDISSNINLGEMGIFLFEDIEGYVFIADDDIIYPFDYIERTIKEYEGFKISEGIVGYHGRIIKKRPIANYYADSYVLSCLEELSEHKNCDIIGTGTICYHTDLFNFQMSLDELLKYPIHMRDIHISLAAKDKGISLYCLKHEKGYLKYNEKMNNLPTIFNTYAKNPVVQTNLINKYNGKFFLYKLFQKEEYNPLVNIVVINSRQLTNPDYVQSSFDSIRNQNYKNIKPIVVDNYHKLMTIGKCWNEAVKQCQGEWVFFLGDDDYITEDYISSLITNYNSLPNDYKEKVVAVSSFCTIFRDSGEYERKDTIPTGMWKREYLLKYPFKEYLTCLVDSSYMDATKERGDIIYVVEHQYGIFYRSHSGQVSGIKALGNEPSTAVNNDVQKQLKNMNLE